MQTMRSEFEAKVAIGMPGSIAIMALTERQITIDGEVVPNGCDFAVKNDMESDSPHDWFHHLRDFGEGEEIGIYLVKGRVKFDEDSSDYYNVVVERITEQ